MPVCRRVMFPEARESGQWAARHACLLSGIEGEKQKAPLPREAQPAVNGHESGLGCTDRYSKPSPPCSSDQLFHQQTSETAHFDARA